MKTIVRKPFMIRNFYIDFSKFCIFFWLLYSLSFFSLFLFLFNFLLSFNLEGVSIWLSGYAKRNQGLKRNHLVSLCVIAILESMDPFLHDLYQILWQRLTTSMLGRFLMSRWVGRWDNAPPQKHKPFWGRNCESKKLNIFFSISLGFCAKHDCIKKKKF